MTNPHVQHDAVIDSPACTPGAVRAVLAAHAGADVLAAYDRDLDAAFEQARADGDLSPLVQTVRGWWFEADSWRIQALQIQGQEIAAAFQSVQMDFSGSAGAFGYSGGRDLAGLADDARDQHPSVTRADVVPEERDRGVAD